MLWTIFVIVLVLWLVGLVTAYTLGGFIHLLLVIAVVVLVVRLGPLQSLEQKVGLSNRGPPNSTYNLAFTLTFGATQRITPLILLY